MEDLPEKVMGRMLVSGKDGGGNNRTDDGDWTVVDHRRKKNTTIRGSKKNNDLSAVKGIGNTIDVYVGKCVKSVTEDALGKYIKDQAGIDVVNCICLSDDNSDIKSFKVTVAAKDRDALLDASIWPENISVRKYFKKLKGTVPHRILKCLLL